MRSTRFSTKNQTTPEPVPSRSRDKPQETSLLCVNDSPLPATPLVTKPARGSSRSLNLHRPLLLEIRRNLLQRDGTELRAIPCRHRGGWISRHDEHSRFDD